MKVSQDVTSQEYLRKLNASQRNLVTQKEQEIKNLNNLYNEKVKDAKVEGEKNVFLQQEKNKQDVVNQIQEKENHLLSIREGMKKNAGQLLKEKGQLTETLQDQIENTNAVFDEKIRHIHNDNQVKSTEIVEATKSKFKDLQFKSEQEIKQMNFEAKSRADGLSRDHQRTVRNLDQMNKNNVEKLKGEHQDNLKQIDSEHLTKVAKQSRSNEVELQQRQNFQKNELNNLKVHHNEILKQQRVSFKEKYDLMVNNQTEILNRMKTKFDTEVKELVKKYSDFKNQTLSKIEDKFYNVSKLQPEVLDNVSSYEIKVKVPPHEQELVNLTAQERDLKMTLSRRYSDKTENEVGEKNQTKRSEVLTKHFKVADIMDSSSVTRKYQDGFLTFSIKKM